MNGHVDGDKLKAGIFELLVCHPEGLSVNEIAEKMKVNRGTATKYLLVLEAVGEIRRRKIGSATLHYTNGDD